MEPNAIVLSPEQYEELKLSLKNELRGELQQELTQGPAYYYSVIRDLVFKRFARTDKGNAVNYEVARAFSAMVRDGFGVDHVYHLTPAQGEAAIKMTQEIIEVVDKYSAMK